MMQSHILRSSVATARPNSICKIESSDMFSKSDPRSPRLTVLILQKWGELCVYDKDYPAWLVGISEEKGLGSAKTVSLSEKSHIKMSIRPSPAQQVPIGGTLWHRSHGCRCDWHSWGMCIAQYAQQQYPGALLGFH